MTIDFENILNASEKLLEVVRNWRNGTTVSQYMITNHYISLEEHNRWIQNLRKKTTAKAWIIRVKGKPVGVVSLTNIDRKKKTAEWGFYIADVSVRGKGVGSAVLYQLLEYAFGALHLQSITTSVLGNNPTALHLYEKFGFEIDPEKKQSLMREGRVINVSTMTLSRDTWTQKRKSLQKESKQKDTARLS